MPVSNLLALGGVVMWPLLGFSIFVTALVLERLLFWGQIGFQQPSLIRSVLHLYPRDPKAAFTELEKHANLPISRIFLAALELDQATPEEFNLALESAAQAELPILKRFSTVFETVIGVAPLLGLLGTILGLINTFAALRIGDVGGSSTAGVTAGISEALISTAAGLVVAIFTLLFANLFRGLYLRQLSTIQEFGGRLELLYRYRYAASQRSRM
ncbi:MAG: MotA/TolQ/ExbB proton channel family protein [Thainema sp.]